jgi:hypothetical protein
MALMWPDHLQKASGLIRAYIGRKRRRRRGRPGRRHRRLGITKGFNVAGICTGASDGCDNLADGCTGVDRASGNYIRRRTGIDCAADHLFGVSPADERAFYNQASIRTRLYARYYNRSDAGPPIQLLLNETANVLLLWYTGEGRTCETLSGRGRNFRRGKCPGNDPPDDQECDRKTDEEFPEHVNFISN